MLALKTLQCVWVCASFTVIAVLDPDMYNNAVSTTDYKTDDLSYRQCSILWLVDPFRIIHISLRRSFSRSGIPLPVTFYTESVQHL